MLAIFKKKMAALNWPCTVQHPYSSNLAFCLGAGMEFKIHPAGTPYE
jgi:hypothetical protein